MNPTTRRKDNNKDKKKRGVSGTARLRFSLKVSFLINSWKEETFFVSFLFLFKFFCVFVFVLFVLFVWFLLDHP